MYKGLASRVSIIFSIDVLLLPNISLSSISIYEDVKFEIEIIPFNLPNSSTTGKDLRWLSLIIFQAFFKDKLLFIGDILSISKSSTFSLTVSNNLGASTPK